MWPASGPTRMLTLASGLSPLTETLRPTSLVDGPVRVGSGAALSVEVGPGPGPEGPVVGPGPGGPVGPVVGPVPVGPVLGGGPVPDGPSVGGPEIVGLPVGEPEVGGAEFVGPAGPVAGEVGGVDVGGLLESPGRVVEVAEGWTDRDGDADAEGDPDGGAEGGAVAGAFASSGTSSAGGSDVLSDRDGSPDPGLSGRFGETACLRTRVTVLSGAMTAASAPPGGLANVYPCCCTSSNSVLAGNTDKVETVTVSGFTTRTPPVAWSEIRRRPAATTGAPDSPVNPGGRIAGAQEEVLRLQLVTDPSAGSKRYTLLVSWSPATCTAFDRRSETLAWARFRGPSYQVTVP